MSASQSAGEGEAGKDLQQDFLDIACISRFQASFNYLAAV
jgi:hypothetical protein